MRVATVQQFKSVYFTDHPAATTQGKNVKLAFGPADAHVFQLIRPLSSGQIRDLIGIGSYRSLVSKAKQNCDSVNGYCIRRLRAAVLDNSGTNRVDSPLGATPERFIDPLQTTFRGGKNEPLHDWYSYLEGYSPEFVERLIFDFASDAQHVCDPFAGTGTTPLTACRLGHQSYFCELNPLLQILIQAKVRAYNLDQANRNSLFSELKVFAQTLARRLENTQPDQRLAKSFVDIFGSSIFFTPSEFRDALRLRSLVDELRCTDVSLSSFVLLGVLSSLIPASLLIRRGDVRFKTRTELKKHNPSLVDLVSQRLDRMAHDLLRVAPLSHNPVLLASDARDLHKLCPLEIDTLITSPPYLNGTNYFRNTKVELWFLRCLTSSHDLAWFRRRAVTAGINDVTVGKATGAPTKSVARIVEALAEDAYDARIPRMVQTYFHDMSTVFDKLLLHLKSRAAVLIDIGDSSYGGVRVPTPQLLKEMLEERGFEHERDVVLRRRASRGGEALSQVLLVMHAPKRAVEAMSAANQHWPWEHSWNCFKSDLPHQTGVKAKRNWGSGLHSLCSYQGKMKPSLAASLIETFVPKAGRVLDPFGGVGTIPFEAAMAGHKSWSFDISPAAVQIARAKLQPTTSAACNQVIHDLMTYTDSTQPLDDDIHDAAQIRFNGPLTGYFHPKTFSQIITARRYFLDNSPTDPASAVVFSCLLHILHGNRPYALSRRSHPITPFAPTGKSEFRSMADRLRAKVEKSLGELRPDCFVPGESVLQDSTETWPQDIIDLDAIITSPPFFDSTRFYLANWMRLWFCGWNARDFRDRPLAFMDERQKKSFDVYEPVLRQCRERLKVGGVLVLHLGKSNKCDMAEQLKRVARHWFRTADIFHENVQHCESHGIRDKGTVREHSYLVLV